MLDKFPTIFEQFPAELLQILNELTAIEILITCGMYSEQKELPESVILIVKRKTTEADISDDELDTLLANGASFIPSLPHYLIRENTYNTNWSKLCNKYFSLNFAGNLYSNHRKRMLNKIIALTKTVRINPCFIDNHRTLIDTLGAQIRAIQSKTPTKHL